MSKHKVPLDSDWDDIPEAEPDDPEPERNDTPTPAAPTHKSPFGIEAVDPLVYRQTDDSPELRAAAAYVPITPRLQVKDARPVPPRKKYFGKWTPGGEEKTEEHLGEGNKERTMPKSLSVALVLLVSILPIAIGWFLIVTALNFYDK